MFFQMASRRDPMAEVRAFAQRAEAARSRPLSPAEMRSIVRDEFGTAGEPELRLVVTREDMDRANRVRLSAPPQRRDRLAGRVGNGARDAAGRASQPRTQTPTPQQRAFLQEQLARRGLPTRQVDDLRFVSGLDSNANLITRTAFNSGVNAVTQGSTVYVRPDRFDEVANFRSPTGFEEAYHTAQFALDDSFYPTYFSHWIGGLLSEGDGYNGNVYEAFAKGASRQMFDEYQSLASDR